jgi:hypothetical protein
MKGVHTSPKVTEAVTAPTPHGTMNNSGFYKEALKKTISLTQGADALKKLASRTQTCSAD